MGMVGRIIAVTNQKGGVGKTTTAVNLSATMAELGQKVLLMDLDPQGNATVGLGIDRKNLDLSIYDVLIKGARLENALRETPVSGLHLVPATIDLAGAEIELVNQISRETRLKKAIHQIRDRYDFIFIDCPPSLGLLTINALTAADSVLIPIQCEYYALEGVSLLHKTIELVKEALNPELDLEGVLLTMYDGRTNLSAQVAESVKDHQLFRGKLYRSTIVRNVRLSEAPSHGIPINMYDPKSKGAEGYYELAREVIEHAEERAG